MKADVGVNYNAFFTLEVSVSHNVCHNTHLKLHPVSFSWALVSYGHISSYKFSYDKNLNKGLEKTFQIVTHVCLYHWEIPCITDVSDVQYMVCVSFQLLNSILVTNADSTTLLQSEGKFKNKFC